MVNEVNPKKHSLSSLLPLRVIFDSRWGGQFEPVRNGTIYDAPAPSSIVAAKLCLEGANAVGDSLYFLAPALTSNHWAMNQRTYVTTIGCHWFYR